MTLCDECHSRAETAKAEFDRAIACMCSCLADPFSTYEKLAGYLWAENGPEEFIHYRTTHTSAGIFLSRLESAAIQHSGALDKAMNGETQ
jgi:hypothetical protein